MLLPLDLRSSGRSVRKATAITPGLIWLSTKRIGLPLMSLGAGLSAAPARGAAVAAARARALTAARMREEEDIPPWWVRGALSSGPPRWRVGPPLRGSFWVLRRAYGRIEGRRAEVVGARRSSSARAVLV